MEKVNIKVKDFYLIADLKSREISLEILDKPEKDFPILTNRNNYWKIIKEDDFILLKKGDDMYSDYPGRTVTSEMRSKGEKVFKIKTVKLDIMDRNTIRLKDDIYEWAWDFSMFENIYILFKHKNEFLIFDVEKENLFVELFTDLIEIENFLYEKTKV